MRTPSFQLQVRDDPALLKLMLQDMRAAPDIYGPGNYWKNYEGVFLPELEGLGLKDFRRRRDSVLNSFGATDEPIGHSNHQLRPRGIRRTPSRRGNVNSLLLSAILTVPYLAKRLAGTRAFTGISQAGLGGLCCEYAALYGQAYGAERLESLDVSLWGNPVGLISYKDRAYTASFLNYYLNYAYCCRWVDFSSTKTVMELGPGAGKQVEVLRKAHPHLCFFLFDIPPQLYVCEQYLSAVFPGSVVSYRTTRQDGYVPEASPGRIFVMGPWMLPRLKELTWDFFWNAASLQEMEPSMALNYLSYVERGTRSGAYLDERMDGMHTAATPGEHGVLSPTTISHYRAGLPSFDTLDVSTHQFLPDVTMTSAYSRSFWTRKAASAGA